MLGLPNNTQQTSCSSTLPTMPQKKSVYGDAITDNTETCDSNSQTTSYAEEIEPEGERTPVTEEPPTATETTPDATTPLPTTPIGCSKSHDPRPSQRAREQDRTPIRVTVTAYYLNTSFYYKLSVLFQLLITLVSLF